MHSQRHDRDFKVIYTANLRPPKTTNFTVTIFCAMKNLFRIIPLLLMLVLVGLSGAAIATMTPESQFEKGKVSVSAFEYNVLDMYNVSQNGTAITTTPEFESFVLEACETWDLPVSGEGIASNGIKIKAPSNLQHSPAWHSWTKALQDQDGIGRYLPERQ